MLQLSSADASKEAYFFVRSLQEFFVQNLDRLSAEYGSDRKAKLYEWLRNDGKWGGGFRFELQDEAIFNRGSVNISQVHYENEPSKNLLSATAISTIIHPKNPLAPSMHMHISWTEYKDKKGYWRLMADLNPSGYIEEDRRRFEKEVAETLGELCQSAKAQGDKYFYIPALGRTRGVIHFYLEGFHSGDFANDLALANGFGRRVIESYIKILNDALTRSYGNEERDRQLAYHTLYLFQVLTLDRGTTAGLLVHNENDLGIMASLPRYVDVELLKSFQEKMDPKQHPLLWAIVNVLGKGVAHVDETKKLQLAEAIRTFYAEHPDALALQARGDIVPPTIANHRS